MSGSKLCEHVTPPAKTARGLREGRTTARTWQRKEKKNAEYEERQKKELHAWNPEQTRKSSLTKNRGSCRVGRPAPAARADERSLPTSATRRLWGCRDQDPAELWDGEGFYRQVEDVFLNASAGTSEPNIHRTEVGTEPTPG